jgi:hypothetical protein
MVIAERLTADRRTVPTAEVGHHHRRLERFDQ